MVFLTKLQQPLWRSLPERHRGRGQVDSSLTAVLNCTRRAGLAAEPEAPATAKGAAATAGGD